MLQVRHFIGLLLVAVACVSEAHAQTVTRDIPYATTHERQVLDVYAPAGAKNLPVVFWIHGGGWQSGDKSMVALKPRAFMDASFVFVSINHRLLPTVDMAAITGDVARALAGYTRTSRPTAVIRTGCWSWAIRQAGSSPR